jgi:hypothetical protein
MSLMQNEMRFEVVVVAEATITQVTPELRFDSTLITHVSLESTFA